MKKKYIYMSYSCCYHELDRFLNSLKFKQDWEIVTITCDGSRGWRIVIRLKK